MKKVILLAIFAAVSCFGAVTTDSLKAKGSVIVVKDSAKFADGVYFAGIGRFAGTLYAPVVDIDSMVGDVKTGGSIGINCGLTNTWQSSYSVIDMRGYGVVYGSPNATGYIGGTYGQIGISQNSRYNGGSYALGNGASSSMLLGTGKVVFSSADSVGAGEVQTFTDNVIISKNAVTINGTVTAPRFAGKADTAGLADSAGLAGAATTAITATTAALADSLTSPFYIDTTFYDSLYDDATYKTRSLCRLIQVGKSVTLIIASSMPGTITGTATIRGTPAKFNFIGSSSIVKLSNNGSAEMGTIAVNGTSAFAVVGLNGSSVTGSSAVFPGTTLQLILN